MSEKTPMHEWHPGWHDFLGKLYRSGVSRRAFLRNSAAVAAGAVLSPLLKFSRGNATAPVIGNLGLPDNAGWAAPGSGGKIKHVVVLCQENRSFDHYFGKFGATEFGTPGKRPAVFDPATTYSASTGTKYKPFYLDYFCDFDPDHSWDGSHEKWNAGAMDGWVKAENDSPFALGYYDKSDHLYHVDLAKSFTLADHYFCSQISQTLPNRLYLWTGTSGWGYDTDGSKLPKNNPAINKPPPRLGWTTLPDVLDQTSVNLPWKCYSVADGSLPSPIGAFNPLIFFKQFQENPARLARATTDFNAFFADLATGNLPAVSYIITQAVVSEHPPAPPDAGQLLAARVVRALMESTAWSSTALFLTYDEAGGYFDHVTPPIWEEQAGEAVGPAFRVPMTVVSPWARRNHIFTEVADHTSVLKFIEWNFNVPPDLPIAAGRRTNASDMKGAFDFTQPAPPPTPMLPAPNDLMDLSNETLTTLDIHRGFVECTTTTPRWLLPLMGQQPPHTGTPVTEYPSPTPEP